MNVEKVALQNFRNEEWFQFFKDFKALVGADAADLKIDTVYPFFLQLLDDADTVLEQIRKSAYTARIAEADRIRDTAYGSLRTFVKGNLDHFDANKAEAAERLYIVISRYGNIAAQNYSQQTGAVYNFLQEMKGRNAADILLLALEQWIDRLEEANLDVERLLAERDDEKDRQTALKMKTVRKNLDELYVQQIVRRLEAAVVLSDDATVAAFISRLNVTIQRYKDQLARRKTKKTNNE